MKKTKEEILNQLYLSPKDIKTLMPTYGIEKCRALINEVRKEMDDRKYYVPTSKPRLALTKLVKKRLGI